MTAGRHFRDERLGQALRELAVPEHTAPFFLQLERRLATTPAQRRRRARVTSRMLAAAALAAALTAALVLVVHRVGSTDTARAASLEARVVHALADARTTRGRLVYTAVDPHTQTPTTTRQTFAADSTGSFHVTDLSGPGATAYDAARGVERAITTSASIGSGRFFAERDRVAPGAPDQGPTDFVLERELGAVTRALAAGHDPRVHDVVYEGRPAWRLDVAVAPNTIFADLDALEVTVDRETVFPVHVVTRLHGRVRSELRLEDVVLDQPLPRGALSIAFPAGAEVLRTDGGFTPVGLAGLEDAAGHEPLLPAWVPPGFHVAAASVARAAPPTGPGGSNPPSRNVVSVVYRRGFEQFVVTSRTRETGGWRDPFGVEGVAPATRAVELRAGALAGTIADVVVDPRTLPHLWALGPHLVVTVGGDLDRSQLVAVAESLR